jgi:hypothetical protein
MPRRIQFSLKRFSLRSLLVVVTALAVWLGLEANAAKRQSDAVLAIRNTGGVVVYDFETGEESTFASYCRRLAANDVVSSVAEVRFYGPKVRDADLQIVRSLTSIKRLVLTDTSHSDAGLEEFKRTMPKCQVVIRAYPQSNVGMRVVPIDRKGRKWRILRGPSAVEP